MAAKLAAFAAAVLIAASAFGPTGYTSTPAHTIPAPTPATAEYG